MTSHNTIPNAPSTTVRLYAILTVIGFLLSVSFVSLSWTDGDEGRYTVLAESIATGHGQSMIYLPEPQPEWLTPPAYPFLLGMTYLITGHSVLALKLFSLISYLLFLPILLSLFLRLSDDQKTSLMLAIFGGCGIMVLSFSWQILSETAYLAASFLCLLYLARTNRPETAKNAILAGLLAGICLLIRPVAITLIGAGFLYYLWRRRFKFASFFMLGALIANLYTIARTQQVIGVPFAYLAHYQEYGSDPSHGHALFNTFRTLAALLPRYLLAIPDMLFFSLFSEHCLLCRLHVGFLVMPGKVILLALILVGLVPRLLKPSALELYFLMYLCLISTYNPAKYLEQNLFLPQFRYLICMLPLAAYYLVQGWQSVVAFSLQKRTTLRRNVFRSGLIICTVYVLGTSSLAGFLRLRHEWPLAGTSIWDPIRLEQADNTADHAFAQYMRSAFWIRDNLPTNAVVASRKPEHTYLFSRRKSFRYDGVDITGSNVWDIISSQGQYGSLYILQDAFPTDTVYGQDRITMLDPLIEKRKDQMKLIYESAAPTTRVWRVRLDYETR